MSPAAATRIGLAIVAHSSAAIQVRARGYRRRVDENGTPFQELLETLKKVTGILREAEIPFLLGGGVAAWARGGPESDHDLDLMLKQPDAERALEVLGEAGLRTERPPEGWLYKVFDGDVMVDLIFEPSGQPIEDAVFERAEDLNVNAVPMRVMALEDVLVTKLNALREHELDYESVVEMARTVREQVDWEQVRQRTADSPYAKAFFTLLEELGIVEATG
jgi:predicted nucleotidyltransferase